MGDVGKRDWRLKDPFILTAASGNIIDPKAVDGNNGARNVSLLTHASSVDCSRTRKPVDPLEVGL